MTYELTARNSLSQEQDAIAHFLDSPSQESFARLFQLFTPQLVSFYRARGCDSAQAEDLAQEVMFTVHRKATQIRDRALFRAWLFKIARNTLCRSYVKQTRQVDTVELENVPERLVATTPGSAGTPAFEFHHWMALLDSREREALTLRFVEEWEYHEIAAARSIPMGTVQWRVFSAKKKLAPYLKRTLRNPIRKAA